MCGLQIRHTGGAVNLGPGLDDRKDNCERENPSQSRDGAGVSDVASIPSARPDTPQLVSGGGRHPNGLGRMTADGTYRHRAAVVGAVPVVAALGLLGCSHREPPPAAAPLTAPVPAAIEAAQTTELPVAEVLTNVLYRLADPALPAAEKLSLIEGAADTDASTLDKFTAALKDSGYLPLSFNATDIGWSDRHPGNAVANVDVGTANPESGGFSFPMEFKPRGAGWQLSQQTAEMLLAFGNARTEDTSDAAPTR